MRAAIYKGRRDDDSNVAVEADGDPLPFYHGVFNHSPNGFEWGYSGSAPSQLALAICCDALGIPPETRAPRFFADASPELQRALRIYHDFKARTVARWTADTWELSRGEVLAIIAAIDPGGAQLPLAAVAAAAVAPVDDSPDCGHPGCTNGFCDRDLGSA